MSHPAKYLGSLWFLISCTCNNPLQLICQVYLEMHFVLSSCIHQILCRSSAPISLPSSDLVPPKHCSFSIHNTPMTVLGLRSSVGFQSIRDHGWVVCLFFPFWGLLRVLLVQIIQWQDKAPWISEWMECVKKGLVVLTPIKPLRFQRGFVTTA